jgi:hypothetical protein
MAIIWDDDGFITRFIWTSANFASGGGSTTLAWRADFGVEWTVEDMVELVRDEWVDHLRSTVDTDMTLDRIDWETAVASGTLNVAMAGTANLNSPPPNTSILSTYKAVGKGPRTRGRSFWPGMVQETNVDERGQIAGSTRSALITAMNLFFGGVIDGSAGGAQVIAQTDSPGNVTSPIVPWPVVTNRSVSPLVATQRRRLRR